VVFAPRLTSEEPPKAYRFQAVSNWTHGTADARGKRRAASAARVDRDETILGGRQWGGQGADARGAIGPMLCEMGWVQIREDGQRRTDDTGRDDETTRWYVKVKEEEEEVEIDYGSV
jgi:hypothetical protein